MSTNDGSVVTKERYQALLGVSRAIAICHDSSSLLQVLVPLLHSIVDFDCIDFVLYDSLSGKVLVQYPGDQWVDAAEYHITWDEGPGAQVYATQSPLVCDFDEFSRRFPQLVKVEPVTHPASFCAVPLSTARRRLGCVEFFCETVDAYANQEEVDFLKEIAMQVAVSVDNALNFERACALESSLTVERDQLRKLKEKLASEKVYLEEEIASHLNIGQIIGESDALHEVIRQVEMVAPSDSTVLLTGETGTGKELIARAIHEHSKRQGRTMVRVNCSSIPAGLLESDLFGHEKGAFTGAYAQKIGRFELANEGTLFLDEVGEISLELQPKLLRVLQEKEFERVGGNRVIQVDTRVIAATNRSLEEMIERHEFRSDLYYRLNVFPIYIPPLRNRKEDIPLLAHHFTQKYARAMKRKIEFISTTTMEQLTEYAWPGNIRELQNVIERAVIVSTGPELKVPFIPSRKQNMSGHGKLAAPGLPSSHTLNDIDREHILATLRETNGIVAGPKGAAARLGIGRTTLIAKMNRLGISAKDILTKFAPVSSERIN